MIRIASFVKNPLARLASYFLFNTRATLAHMLTITYRYVIPESETIIRDFVVLRSLSVMTLTDDA